MGLRLHRAGLAITLVILTSGAGWLAAAGPAAADAAGTVTLTEIEHNTLLYPGNAFNDTGRLGIAVGPDGNLWFPDVTPSGGTYPSRLGRITTDNTFRRPFNVGEAVIEPIVRGSDGNIWYAETFSGGPGGASIVRVDAAGRETRFPVCGARSCAMRYLTAAPDGTIWFVQGIHRNANDELVASINRLAPDGSMSSWELRNSDGSPKFALIAGLTAGPDGNVWFTESNVDTIGRITPSGEITEFPTDLGGPQSIISFAGDLWFGAGFSVSVGRMNTQGVQVASYDGDADGLGGFQARDLTAGPDGVYFTVTRNQFGLGRVTADGIATRFDLGLDSPIMGPLTTGPDNNIWFRAVDSGRRLVGRLVTGAAPQQFTPTPAAITGARPSGSAPASECPPDPAPGLVINGNLTITSGDFCFLNQATVNGDVIVAGDPEAGPSYTDLGFSVVKGRLIVSNGGEVNVHDSTVNGGIQADGAGFVEVFKSTVGNSLAVSNSTHGLGFLCNSTVNGGVSVSGTTNSDFPMTIGNPAGDCGGNRINGGLMLTANAAPAVVNNNTVKGTIACNGNASLPTGSGNTAKKTGQCVGL